MSLRIHAICAALNEEVFIGETLKAIYPHCSGISVISQYDRDYYGNAVEPDATISKVLNFPDANGKLHLVVRRWKDQAESLNDEMLALTSNPARRVQSHGTPIQEICAFHEPPDYFLIVDADEIYDADTFGNILSFLEGKKPRGMRMIGYNYVRTWNHRAPQDVVEFKHFGFIRPGVLMEQQRIHNWNEFRLSKFLRLLRLPDFSARCFGFIDCPEEVGIFHHGCWLGNNVRLAEKRKKSAGQAGGAWDPTTPEEMIAQVDKLRTEYVPREALPENIREGDWPSAFFDQGVTSDGS